MYGANASSKPYELDSPRYIRITDIDDEGNLIKEDKVTIDSSDYNQYILSDNDFLFARTGNTVGKTLLYKNKMGNAVFAGYLIKFDINEESLSKLLYKHNKSCIEDNILIQSSEKITSYDELVKAKLFVKN